MFELVLHPFLDRTIPRSPRHQEWLGFLRKIDRQAAPELELHLICDNYATHKHARATAWPKRHPRFHLHFIPTSSSWPNLVERFFGEMTAKVIRPGSFRSVGPWSPTSAASWIITTSIPSPTAGRQTPSTFSKSSIAPGRPCSKKYTIQFMGHHTRMDRNVVSRLQRSYFTARLKT